ncbi:hypothetical protein [Gordoniibacillus kamchatkensis]|nr:hypothetical protein [Paenibacillus sp. VKM B-2647]
MQIVVRTGAGRNAAERQSQNQQPTTFSTFREVHFDELQKRKGYSSP